MVVRVLWYLFWFILLGLIVFWFVSGGVSRVVKTAQSIGSPLGLLTATSTRIMLPGAPTLPRGIDISPLVGNGAVASTYGGESGASDFGNPSPYHGVVGISLDGAQTSDPRAEYIVIDIQGADAVDITGWSLQSALSGIRVYIPRGAPLFSQGTVNNEGDITLSPDGIATVVSGYSPVGVSFRVNECTGYLAQTQRFTPNLGRSCPAPSDELSMARSYGAVCADYISSLPSCTLPTTFPSNVPLSCALFVQDVFSYNGCVREHEGDAHFASNEWRIYLGSSGELWNNTHDIVRLLDAQSRTVDVESY